MALSSARIKVGLVTFPTRLPGMFELAAALALVYTIIFGVSKGYHKEGGGGVVAFLAMYVIAFIVIAATIAVFEYVT